MKKIELLTKKNKELFDDFLIGKIDNTVIKANIEQRRNDIDAFDIWDILPFEAQEGLIKNYYYRELNIVVFTDFNTLKKRWYAVAVGFGDFAGNQKNKVLFDGAEQMIFSKDEREILKDIYTRLDFIVNKML